VRPGRETGSAPARADPRTTRRYDHGGARLDRAPANMLVGYIETGDSAK